VNQKGQAMIEAVIILAIALIFSIKAIQLGLNLHYEILVDDLIEQTLICHYQKKSTCISDLRHRLNELSFHDVQISDRSDSNTSRLRLQLTTGFGVVLTRESELTLDLSI
jgi:preprotein translocase subunit SecF